MLIDLFGRSQVRAGTMTDVVDVAIVGGSVETLRRAVQRLVASRVARLSIQYEEHCVDPGTGSPQLQTEYRREKGGKDSRRITSTAKS